MFSNRDESVVVPENSFLVAIHLNFEAPVPGIYMCNQSMACRSFNRGYRGRRGRHNRRPVAVAGLSQVDTHDGSRCGKNYGQCYKPSHRNFREASAAPVAPAKSAFPHILWHRPTALAISVPGCLLRARQICIKRIFASVIKSPFEQTGLLEMQFGSTDRQRGFLQLLC